MKKWLQLSFVIHQDLIDEVSEYLENAGALAISLTAADDHPLFQTTPGAEVFHEQMRMTVLFPDNMSPLNVKENLVNAFPKLDTNTFQDEIIAEQNWVALTQQNFPPLCFADKLWVYPSWTQDTQQQPSITIDPGLAFGTGTHPTTAMILSWLAEHPPLQQTVIDYGCGSGILSLVAARLGATEVIAIDHDPQALTSTHNNIELNPDLKSGIKTFHSDQHPTTAASLVIANILAKPLIELSQHLIQLTQPHGTLLLSGLLTTEKDLILNCYQDFFKNCKVITQDEWCLIICSDKH